MSRRCPWSKGQQLRQIDLDPLQRGRAEVVLHGTVESGFDPLFNQVTSRQERSDRTIFDVKSGVE